MRKGIGIGCIVIGICCLLSSVGIVFYNNMQDKNAKESSKVMLQDVQEQMMDMTNEVIVQTNTFEMPTTKVDAYDCIGILSIPVLELELPVLTDWNYTKLKKAPCLYYGTYYESDFVIAAHNSRAHFGGLSQLQARDLILFTDVLGNVHYYEVVLIETLSPKATKEMITSGFDLSLYTCTRGGGNRITVRCSKIYMNEIKRP